MFSCILQSFHDAFTKDSTTTMSVGKLSVFSCSLQTVLVKILQVYYFCQVIAVRLYHVVTIQFSLPFCQNNICFSLLNILTPFTSSQKVIISQICDNFCIGSVFSVLFFQLTTLYRSLTVLLGLPRIQVQMVRNLYSFAEPHDM